MFNNFFFSKIVSFVR